MRTIQSASLLALGILIAGCGRNEDAVPAESKETPAETTAETEPDPKKDLIEACPGTCPLGGVGVPGSRKTRGPGINRIAHPHSFGPSYEPFAVA